MAAAEEEAVEITLSVLPTCNVYKIPPRPDARGWVCQDWPKESHVFTGRVRIVAAGSQCTVRLEDPAKEDALFAKCPLDNDNPSISIEPVVDSSRYFVLRVADNTGRHAYLGMGFAERSDAFEFNVTLQDHVKRLRNEQKAEAAFEAAQTAPPAPAQDFTLKGSVSIALPGGGSSKPRAAPAGDGGLAVPLMPPPPGGGPPKGRPTAGAAAAADPFAGSDPFAGTDPFGSSSTADPFAGTAAGADPFAAQPGGADPFAGAADPFAGSAAAASDPFSSGGASGAASAAADPFAGPAGATDPFAAAPPPPPKDASLIDF